MAIIQRNCPHCPAEHVAFQIVASKKAPGESYISNCLAECAACGGPICFKVYQANMAADPIKSVGNIETHYEILGVWPLRAEATAPGHLPNAVERRFLEGENAYGRRSWNAAVAMYRSALDIATKGLDGVPAGKTFFKRLEWLHENGRITSDMRAWADHVRVEGNEALHDPDDFEEEDTKPLRLFTEMFLKYVFELPGEVCAFRGETENN